MTEWGQPFVPNVRQPTVLLPATASVLPRELSGVSCVASCVVVPRSLVYIEAGEGGGRGILI